MTDTIDYEQLAKTMLAAAPAGAFGAELDLSGKLEEARAEADRQRLRADALAQQVGQLETRNAELSRQLRERQERGNFQQMKEIIAAVEKCGWSAELRSTTGHYHLTGPAGEKYTCSSTPSDHRSIKNHVADLRRMGVPI